MAHCKIYKTFRFESAHYLPYVPADHKCSQLHGHSYQITIYVQGETDPKHGWVMDFATIKERFDPLRRQLDHTLLNEIPGLENPTCENLTVWLWDRLKDVLPGLTQIVVNETETSGCSYSG